ncbi:cytochrome P450 [Streptomyces sp. V4I8]|uniref:cytochrome P450 n=1 Tax=Streptomyces sp. V4I8 TaxID=3156469 RepID=UPI003517D202
MTQPSFRPYTHKADIPWEELAHDRSRCPVVHSEHLDAVQISSYAGVREVLQNLDKFTSTYSTLWPREEPLPEAEQVFAAADPPRHTRQRRLCIKALSASRIQHMRPFSERLADRLIDAIVAEGPTFDLVSTFARKVSEGHIGELLGLPDEDREHFLHLSALFELSTADPKSQAYSQEMAHWHAGLMKMVRERREAGSGSDDLITTLCFAELEDGDRLDEAEVAAMIRSVIRAGNTTTSAAIVNIVASLEWHPEQKAKYLADIEGLTPSLVEEGLRYDGPVLGLWRRCAQATTVQGHPLEPGDRIFSLYASGNHDPEVFDRPDEFVIDRDWKKMPPHLAFGYGIHHCIGMNLARLECETALSALYRRLPQLRLKPGAPIPQLPGPVFRTWTSLEMEYTASDPAAANR